MLRKKRRDFVFSRLTTGDGKNQRFQGGVKFILDFLVKPITVQIKKRQGGSVSPGPTLTKHGLSSTVFLCLASFFRDFPIDRLFFIENTDFDDPIS